MSEIYYDWSLESMLEVELSTPDNFLKVKETLTRIGVASKKEKKLTQYCHILHKRGKYYITHFKEMFCLDGKFSSITVDDINRRNAIAILLEEWDLLKVINKPEVDVDAVLSRVKVLSHKEKSEWQLVSKYTIGKKDHLTNPGE